MGTHLPPSVIEIQFRGWTEIESCFSAALFTFKALRALNAGRIAKTPGRRTLAAKPTVVVAVGWPQTSELDSPSASELSSETGSITRINKERDRSPFQEVPGVNS